MDWCLTKKPLHRHHLSRCTVTALEGVVLQECLLHQPKFFTLHQPLKGCNLFPFRLNRKGQAGIVRLSVDKTVRHRFPSLASDLRSRQSEFLAEDKEERQRLHEQPMAPAH